MSIQIIDNFQLSTSLPIDSRIVASGSSARNSISYKYDGLRVFDTSDGIPYVWLNGSWQAESASTLAGQGEAGYFAFFTDSSTIDGSSDYTSGYIYYNSGKIGVNKLDPSSDFDVNGVITAATFSGKFAGTGAAISSLNANNIASGSLSLSRITNGTSGYLLTAGASSLVYINPTQITVGTASVASQVRTVSTDVGSTERYISFIDTINANPTNNTLKANTNLRFKPSTSQLLFSADATESAPSISFIGFSDRGLFKNDTGLGLSVDGVNRLSILPTGISIISSTPEADAETFSISVTSGTQIETTELTIDSISYDRTVYVYTSQMVSGNYIISAGSFQVGIYISDQLVYTNYFSSSSFQTNYSFILPSGLDAFITIEKNGLTWEGEVPVIYTKMYKFGL